MSQIALALRGALPGHAPVGLLLLATACTPQVRAQASKPTVAREEGAARQVAAVASSVGHTANPAGASIATTAAKAAELSSPPLSLLPGATPSEHEVWLTIPGTRERLLTVRDAPPFVCGRGLRTLAGSSWPFIVCDPNAPALDIGLAIDARSMLSLRSRALGHLTGLVWPASTEFLYPSGVEAGVLGSPPNRRCAATSPPIAVNVTGRDTLWLDVPALGVRVRWRARSRPELCWSLILLRAGLQDIYCAGEDVGAGLTVRARGTALSVMTRDDTSDGNTISSWGIELPCSGPVQFKAFALRDPGFRFPGNLCTSACQESGVRCSNGCRERYSDEEAQLTERGGICESTCAERSQRCDLKCDTFQNVK